MVGHSYIVYAPLLLGATTVLYEGKPVGTPDPGAFWRVASEHRVKALFTAPTAIRAIRKEDPDGDVPGQVRPFRAEVSLPGRRTAGPRHLPLGVAEAGHSSRRSLVADRDRDGRSPPTRWGSSALPIKPGSPTVPMPGYDVRILHADGAACEPGEEGVDLPASCRCRRVRCRRCGATTPVTSAPICREHPGYYLTGDGGYVDEDGYLFVMGRIDDVINVAGHRLSTGAIEAVLATHPAVAECAVIGVADEIKGQVPRGFVVLKAGASADGLADELVTAVRNEIGAVACFKLVDVVAALPKTRSGKILRKTMRGIAEGKDEPVPSTIEDPAVLHALRPILQR